MKIEDITKTIPTWNNDSPYGSVNKKDWSRRDFIPRNIVVHCADSTAGPVDIARYHISSTSHIKFKGSIGTPGICYHYYIDQFGGIFKTSDIANKTYHAGGYNTNSIGVCMAYRATKAKNPPDFEIMRSLLDLLSNMSLGFGVEVPNIQGHRELFGTGFGLRGGKKYLRKECPGLLVNLDRLREEVCKIVQGNLKSVGTYHLLVDGKWGPGSKSALKESLGGYDSLLCKETLLCGEKI